MSCEHVLTLSQEFSQDSNSSGETCRACDLKQNLWKCLICGALSCGRRHFDGSGGNGHALEHFESTGHALAVKLGTIAVKADGIEADVFCYRCDEMVLDEGLAGHLGVLGIDASSTRKTEKSTAELNLEINLTHTYAMTDGSGAELKELSGPWFRGFTNLGNSCYLASVLQALRNLDPPAFLAADHDYLQCSSAKASECLACQLKKIYLGELSDDGELKMRPWMFKSVAAGLNSEFQSSRQQDASEFLSHLLENRLKRDRSSSALAAFVDRFALQVEETVVCGCCGRRRVTCSTENSLILCTPADSGRSEGTLDELFRGRFAQESLDWQCDRCKQCSRDTFKQAKLVKLPEYLVVIVNRLKIRNWVPEKAEFHISGMDNENDGLSLLQYCAEKQEEEDFEGINDNNNNDNDNNDNNNNDSNNDNIKYADPFLLRELLMMGIEEEIGSKALIACKNSSVDAAMNLIFEGGSENMQADKGFTEDAVEMLVSAGFSKERSIAALEACSGDLERASDWIFSHPETEVCITTSTNTNTNSSADTSTVIPFDSKYRLDSFITHKGSSLFCGHYVAHLKTADGRWILYNDEKVAEAVIDDSFPIKDAYIYFYKKMNQ